MIKETYINWGPKPFKFVPCWIEHPDFISIIEDVCKYSNIQGMKMFIFKKIEAY